MPHHHAHCKPLEGPGTWGKCLFPPSGSMTPIRVSRRRLRNGNGKAWTHTEELSVTRLVVLPGEDGKGEADQSPQGAGLEPHPCPGKCPLPRPKHH